MELNKLKELYPVRNCEYEKNENGLVIVLFKNTKPSFIEKLFFKKLIEKPYKIDLDEIGSFIYEICDGKLNTEEVINKTREHFGVKVEPTEPRVIKFVEQLNRNKLITLYEKR